jgi:hypothetical protein
VAHTKACALSLRDPSTCKCECNGDLHGRAWIPDIQDSPDVRQVPSRQRTVRSRQRKVRRIALAAAITVTGTVGGLAVTGNFDTSASAGSYLSMQVNVDLKGTITTLSSLGFGGREISSSGTSGSSHSTDCAESATGASF